MLPRGNRIVGSFSQNRPLSWGQGFAGKVNDPLRVTIFLGRPLGRPVRGVVVLWSSREMLLFSWEILCLLEHLLDCLPALFRLLEGPDWGVLPLSLGERVVAWEELLPSLGRRAVARDAWEKLLASPGKVAVAGEALASLGGEVLASPGGMVPAWEVMITSPAGAGLPGKRFEEFD